MLETNNFLIGINAFANAIIFIGIVAFMVFVFGNRNGTMNKLPKWESLSIKIGLSFVCCGSLFNFLTLSLPPTTEILMNIGLAIVFLWGAIFHFKYFIKKDKK